MRFQNSLKPDFHSSSRERYRREKPQLLANCDRYLVARANAHQLERKELDMAVMGQVMAADYLSPPDYPLPENPPPDNPLPETPSPRGKGVGGLMRYSGSGWSGGGYSGSGWSGGGYSGGWWVLKVLTPRSKTHKSNSAKAITPLLLYNGSGVHSGLCRCGRLYFNRMIICVQHAFDITTWDSSCEYHWSCRIDIRNQAVPKRGVFCSSLFEVGKQVGYEHFSSPENTMLCRSSMMGTMHLSEYVTEREWDEAKTKYTLLKVSLSTLKNGGALGCRRRYIWGGGNGATEIPPSCYKIM